jgi:hypothetical protein
MTAAAIASSSAIIDFHGLVLCFTRLTCADRSSGLPFCPAPPLATDSPPHAIGLRAGRDADPEHEKRWGAGAPQRSREIAGYLISGFPTGNLTRPAMPFDIPAAEA